MSEDFKSDAFADDFFGAVPNVDFDNENSSFVEGFGNSSLYVLGVVSSVGLKEVAESIKNDYGYMTRKAYNNAIENVQYITTSKDLDKQFSKNEIFNICQVFGLGMVKCIKAKIITESDISYIREFISSMNTVTDFNNEGYTSNELIQKDNNAMSEDDYFQNNKKGEGELDLDIVSDCVKDFIEDCLRESELQDDTGDTEDYDPCESCDINNCEDCDYYDPCEGCDSDSCEGCKYCNDTEEEDIEDTLYTEKSLKDINFKVEQPKGKVIPLEDNKEDKN